MVCETCVVYVLLVGRGRALRAEHGREREGLACHDVVESKFRAKERRAQRVDAAVSWFVAVRHNELIVVEDATGIKNAVVWTK